MASNIYVAVAVAVAQLISSHLAQFFYKKNQKKLKEIYMMTYYYPHFSHTRPLACISEIQLYICRMQYHWLFSSSSQAVGGGGGSFDMFTYQSPPDSTAWD